MTKPVPSFDESLDKLDVRFRELCEENATLRAVNAELLAAAKSAIKHLSIYATSFKALEAAIAKAEPAPLSDLPRK